MDLTPSDEHEIIRRTAREFVDTHVRPHVAEWEQKGDIPDSVFQEMAKLGFLGAPVPEEYGGAGLDGVGYAILTEEIAKGCSSLRTAMSVQSSLAGMTLLKFGTEEQKDRWLKPLAKGDKLGAWALTESGSGSDAAGMKTRAVHRNGNYVLDGSKMWISQGDKADYVVVFAKTDPSKKHEGISAFLVEKGTDGFGPGSVETTNKLGLRSSHTAELLLEECELPEDHRIGKEGEGWTAAMYTLNHGRLSVAAGAVGIMQAALDASAEYAKKRQAFGRPISDFQLIKAKLADMQVKTEAGRMLVWKAALVKDAYHRGEATYSEWSRAVSIAKLYTAEACVQVAEEGVQIHGANGYSDEYPVGRYWRDAKICGIYEGTNEIQRLLIGRHVLGEEFKLE